MVLREIREISLAGRNPKQEPLMYALALCARYDVVDTRRMKGDDSMEGKLDLQKAAFHLVEAVSCFTLLFFYGICLGMPHSNPFVHVYQVL